MRIDNGNTVSKHHKGYNHTSDNYLVVAVDIQTGYNKRLQLEETQMMLLDTTYPKGLDTRM